MVSLEKWMILTPLLKLPKNGEDWGKLIVAKGFKKLPKIQNIAQSGHTDAKALTYSKKDTKNTRLLALSICKFSSFQAMWSLVLKVESTIMPSAYLFRLLILQR